MTKKDSKEYIEVRKILNNNKNYIKEIDSVMVRARINVDNIEKEVLKIHNKIGKIIENYTQIIFTETAGNQILHLKVPGQHSKASRW